MPSFPTGRLVTVMLLAGVAAGVLAPSSACANPPEPEAHDDSDWDFMHLLAAHNHHDLNDERWNLYGQFTWISSFKLPFEAPYTNANGSNHSLVPGFEHSYTGSLTLFGGLRLWPGAEVYWVPEFIAERPLSNLSGLGGAIQNFELQKTGSPTGTLYSSRLVLRQTINLGGEVSARPSDPMQLGGHVHSRRLTFTVGNFSVLDFFDRNSYAGDLRRQFFNMAFMTYAAFDFAADARGYTWGAVAELNWDDWALRVGHVITPFDPNQLPLNFRFWQYFGDQIEIEHDHTLLGQPGIIRVLGYRNYENMARFTDALSAYYGDPTQTAANCGSNFNYGSSNANAPDLCWARRPNIKLGIGVNLEQSLSHGIGVFLRAMYSDGQSEVYSYTSADRSVSFGALARGSLWHRPRDYAGVGYGASWISAIHAQYLALGGVDGFVGDGSLHAGAETVFECFYGVHLVGSVWLSGDYQFITNPGYNTDRGPVHVFGVRGHAEF